MANDKNKSKKELNDQLKFKEAERKAQDLDVTAPSQWKRKVGQASKLLLPSGHVCLAKNPGMDVFIEQGMIPNSLMPIIMQAVNEGKGAPPNKLNEIANDPQMLAESIQLTNEVVLYCVVQPEISRPPASDTDRDPEALYVDELDLDDKMFVFQWVVGGTRDLERFREETGATVEALRDGEGDEPATVGSDGG